VPEPNGRVASVFREAQPCEHGKKKESKGWKKSEGVDWGESWNETRTPPGVRHTTFGWGAKRERERGGGDACKFGDGKWN